MPELANNDSETPWVETPEGAQFFMNAVLVAPELIVAFPFVVGVTLRATGLVHGPTVFLDVVPWVAGYAIPYVAWLLPIPIWTTLRNLKVASGRIWVALFIFLAMHTSFLGYAVLRWTGVLGAP
ncbi:MAG: hypothetical protein BMS9Abin29_2156 [Gemmatimonadota bacterium]|nr:MAG: hypothetical protein BMS9Abin29_2156 [Gemmatimonadota bacterium]